MPHGGTGIGLARDDSRESRGRGRDSGREGGWSSFGFGPGEDRLRIVFVVFLGIVAVIVLRLFQIQVLEASRILEVADRYETSVASTSVVRGNIYDRNGNALATNELRYNIAVDPQACNATNTLALTVARILGSDASSYVESIDAAKESGSQYCLLARSVTPEVADQIQDALDEADVTGLVAEVTYVRVYPYGQVAGQIVGYANSEGGISGLESYYDDVLSGKSGTVVVTNSPYGIPLEKDTEVVANTIAGQDITISIDVDIQRAAEEAIAEGVVEYEADSGFCMVTDPQSGEIIAACSTPYANPSDPSSFTSEQLNFSMVSSSYEPGSIFKVLTAAIAIENGVADADTTYTVPGQVQVGDDWVMDDDLREETMDMTLREIMRRSSNTGAVLVAEDSIGADLFAEGIERFGIGYKTGIDYPGEGYDDSDRAGIVTSRDQYTSTWPSMAFGQGLAIPMVQMVQAVGSIAADGTIWTPHFLLSVNGEAAEWPSQGTSVSADTASQVTDILRTVVEEGTAEEAAVEGYDVVGKTGTGEQAEDGSYVEGSYLASLIGYAPGDDPEVLVYVGLNGTSYLASSSAAPVFSAIMGEALTNLGVQPTTSTASTSGGQEVVD